MGFDISGVVNEAIKNASFNETREQGNSSKYPYLFLQDGTLKVKFLFNPASGILGRVTRKHFCNKSKAVCLTLYGQPCPVCDVLKQIVNLTGQDMWRYKASPRAIAFVQYIGSSGYKWTIDNPEPKAGAICILMYPWTVYQDLNRIIAGAGNQASKLFATNEGKLLSIMRWKENTMTKYKCEVDAFAPEYQSYSSQEEYERVLNELPSLNDIQCPASPSEKDVAELNEMADTLRREFLRGSVAETPAVRASQFTDMNSVSQTMQAKQAYVAPAPTPVSTPSPTPIASASPAPSGAETGFACIGNHNGNNPRCISCPKEAQCMLICGENVEIPY